MRAKATDENDGARTQQTVDVETLIERLREASANGLQGAIGDLLEEAADALEALSETVDHFG